jgi:hypothetical protein
VLPDLQLIHVDPRGLEAGRLDLDAPALVLPSRNGTRSTPTWRSGSFIM